MREQQQELAKVREAFHGRHAARAGAITISEIAG
jgi:hypothetical protein